MDISFFVTPPLISIAVICILAVMILNVLGSQRIKNSSKLTKHMQQYVYDNYNPEMSVITNIDKDSVDQVTEFVERLKAQDYSALQLVLLYDMSVSREQVRILRKLQKKNANAVSIRVVRRGISETKTIQRYSAGELLCWLDIGD